MINEPTASKIGVNDTRMIPKKELMTPTTFKYVRHRY